MTQCHPCGVGTYRADTGGTSAEDCSKRPRSIRANEGVKRLWGFGF